MSYWGPQISRVEDGEKREEGEQQRKDPGREESTWLQQQMTAG